MSYYPNNSRGPPRGQPSNMGSQMAPQHSMQHAPNQAYAPPSTAGKIYGSAEVPNRAPSNPAQ